MAGSPPLDVESRCDAPWLPVAADRSSCGGAATRSGRSRTSGSGHANSGAGWGCVGTSTVQGIDVASAGFGEGWNGAVRGARNLSVALLPAAITVVPSTAAVRRNGWAFRLTDVTSWRDRRQ
jgi:hypothetical protein